MAAPLTQDQKTIHFLNRTSFGPTRATVKRVHQIGMRAYLSEQLAAETIPDSSIEERVAELKTMRMNSRELLELYPRPSVPKESGMAMAGAMNGPRVVVLELQQARLLRAVYSQRQLYELMVDFWSNHFNVFAGKGVDRWLMTSYDRDTIRPRALGKFRDLLLATAQSPAMLFYLDNWLSVSPNITAARGAANVRRRGINENYAREIMELHTLGVDGGYSQQDVHEIARCFTGWTLRRPREDAEFYFEPRLHDNGAKTVLGTRISGGGMEDGLKVIDLLARHPATEKFIAAKLVRRFVADDPPAGLVNRAAAAFRRSDGDIRAVLQTIIEAPEFFAPEFYQSKVKKPLEYVAGALRLTAAETKVTPQLLRYIGRMGEPLFLAQPPTGYPDIGASWISPDMLLTRMNFAADLVANRLNGVRIPAGTAGDVKAFISLIAPDSLSATTSTALAEAAGTDALALLLASPEFQRR
ncbi:MAG TPA: DUF1800 domain-containing protein [Candidatus Binatia bacterium]|nr:DUF1800 domain-containing protein [Candidatus Binatia bacterium]